jgi:hypothetical protein
VLVLARARDAPLLRHGPEIMQVLVIDHVRLSFEKYDSL